MPIFHAVVEGDPLDSATGSYVFASSRGCKIQDGDGKYRQMVFIGDHAWCNACKSMGVIVHGASLPDCRRFLDLTSGGRRQAVGGDRVRCKCEQLPEIIATYAVQKWRIVDDTGGASRAASSDSPRSSPETGSFDEQVQSIAAELALAGYPYFVETADGWTSYGRTDASGKLPRIVTDGLDEYAVYWGDEALARGK